MSQEKVALLVKTEKVENDQGPDQGLDQEADHQGVKVGQTIRPVTQLAK